MSPSIEVPKQVPSGSRALPMTEEEILRLENILLKERLEQLEAASRRNSLLDYITRTRNIDLNVNKVSVDGKAKTLVISPK